MARPAKDGVDYFPKDSGFYQDDKIRLLRAEFGAKGMYLLDYLLCDLYGKNGYFIKWDKNKCFLVSDGAGCGCTPEFIAEFITGCVRCSFFNERVFDLFGILTSAGIQRRYIRMFNCREEIQIFKEYWLLDTSNKKDVPAGILNKLALISLKSIENPDKSTGNPDKSTGNSQSKVKENKVNNSKEDKSNKAAAAVFNTRERVENHLAEIATHYEKTMGKRLSSEGLVAMSGFLEHMEPAVICDAISKAGDENVYKLSYVRGILNSRKTCGVKTMSDVERDECKHNATKS